ncbi:TPA: hypothetical protein ACQZER_004808 [Escherichia coli]|nr:hypothetical protein pm098_48600 [Escherichia coli]
MDLKNKYFGKTKEEAAKKKIDIKKENKQIFDAVKQFERNEIATVQGKANFITRIAVDFQYCSCSSHRFFVSVKDCRSFCYSCG